VVGKREPEVGTEVKVDNQDVIVMREDDVMAIVD
jgi:co-chaperonin GroES (HSP10)